MISKCSVDKLNNSPSGYIYVHVFKSAIQALEYSWLREWRVLFIADPIDKHNVEAEVVQMIDKLILDYKAK